MSSGATQDESVTAAESTVGASQMPITVRILVTAMGGGLVGMVLMLPVLVGVPVALNLFETGPIVNFASIAGFFGIEPTVTLGIFLFGLGGTLVLPLQFLVVGAFLPPETPRYVRGATFATIYWVGFAFAFWPGEGALTVGLFLVVSLVAHWIYGVTLGLLLDRWTGIPQHRV